MSNKEDTKRRNQAILTTIGIATFAAAVTTTVILVNKNSNLAFANGRLAQVSANTAMPSAWLDRSEAKPLVEALLAEGLIRKPN